MFEDRKKGLEKKVDIDAQKKFKIAAIRNKKTCPVGKFFYFLLLLF